MKTVITKHPRGPFHVVHFSEELPLLPIESRDIWSRDRKRFGRASDLDTIAIEMATINRGRFHQEILDGKAIYHDYLIDLSTIRGLELIYRSGRYQIDVLTGWCFDPKVVCRNVACVVHQHFYSDSELQIDIRVSKKASHRGDTHEHV